MADSAGFGISHVADSPKRDALRQPAPPRQRDREALSTPNETPPISSSRDIPDSAKKIVGVVGLIGANGARPAASAKWSNDQLFYDDEGGDIGLPYDEDAGLISNDLVDTYSDNDTFAYSTNDTKTAYGAATKTEPRSYVVEDYMWEVNPPMSAQNRRNVRPGDIILAPDPQQAYNPRTASGIPTHEGLVSNKLRPMTVMKTHEDEDNLPKSATCLRHYTYQKKGPSNLMSVSEVNKLFKLLERGSYEETSLTGNRPVYGSLFNSTIDPQAYIHGGELVLVRLTNKVRIIGEINILDWARLDIFYKQQGERSVDAVYAQYPELREQAEQKARETSIRARELQGDHHNTRAAQSRESIEGTVAMILEAGLPPHIDIRPTAQSTQHACDRHVETLATNRTGRPGKTIVMRALVNVRTTISRDLQSLISISSRRETPHSQLLDKVQPAARVVVEIQTV
ncbi:uncharacterized protein J4E88_006942 [Alternaria novae-zelandiae]|uniref:uncharacterized protein n=1 Tax=Alternaria novae-zelandiae TaxID=430562 RepID=UPI0020C30BAF|nr:uncharacterized protein J4E88_006942 [Alternaria novae-zelandiae]KAI4677135.1 hypothetical protein J4E88_006942 [Alternaria novae-zelandiae]